MHLNEKGGHGAALLRSRPPVRPRSGTRLLARRTSARYGCPMRAPAISLYDALAYTVPGIVAHQSSFKDGEQLPIPSFDPA